MVVINSKGMGLTETAMAIFIFAGIALVTSTFLVNVKESGQKLSSQESSSGIAALIGAQILGAANSSVVINGGNMCATTAHDVSASAIAQQDPYCCLDSNNPTMCNESRRSLLCGSFGAGVFDTQSIRNAATWARNIYHYCKDGATGACAITNSSGAICSGDGLIFDSPEEIKNLFGLLPVPLSYESLPELQRPKEIRLKIEVVSTADLDTPLPCGGEPSTGWNVSSAMKVKISVGMQDKTDVSRTRYQDYKMHLVWPRDIRYPEVITGTEASKNAGVDNEVHGSQGHAFNVDNEAINSLTTGSFYQNGTPRSPARCTATKKTGWLGNSQEPGYTYSSWQKLEYYATSAAGGISAFCSNGYSAIGASLECCESNGANSGSTTSSSGTTVRVVVTSPQSEGQVKSITIASALGTPAPPKNFIFSPGYCPPTNSYCPDGSQVGPEGGPFVAAGPAQCPANPTWPAYTPNIACHPHDGCFDFCPQGTRSAQGCNPNPLNYCSLGINLATPNRGCAPGVDCAVDARCNDSVCDDCGAGTCPTSTITVTSVNRSHAPYNNLTEFPTPYLGVSGVNGCPDSASYCSVTAPIPSSQANTPAPPFGAGDPRYWLPKDSCGNSCPDGTRTGGACPATNLFCPVSGIGPHVGVAPACGASGVDCTVDANCGSTACDDCGLGTCGTSSLVVTDRVQQINGSGCNIPTSNYCPDDDSIGGLASNGATVGGLAIHKLPVDMCGNACLPGTIGAIAAGCPATVQDPTTCGAPPVLDNCGRRCDGQNGVTVTTCGGCPVNDVCAGKAIYDTSKFCPHAPECTSFLPCEYSAAVLAACTPFWYCGDGVKPWTDINDKFCPNQNWYEKECSDVRDHFYHPVSDEFSSHRHVSGWSAGTKPWSLCPQASSVACGAEITQSCDPDAAFDFNGMVSTARQINSCSMTGVGYNVDQCNANKPNFCPTALSEDNCGNTGCGYGTKICAATACNLLAPNYCFNSLVPDQNGGWCTGDHGGGTDHLGRTLGAMYGMMRHDNTLNGNSTLCRAGAAYNPECNGTTPVQWTADEICIDPLEINIPGFPPILIPIAQVGYSRVMTMPMAVYTGGCGPNSSASNFECSNIRFYHERLSYPYCPTVGVDYRNTYGMGVRLGFMKNLNYTSSIDPTHSPFADHYYVSTWVRQTGSIVGSEENHADCGIKTVFPSDNNARQHVMYALGRPGASHLTTCGHEGQPACAAGTTNLFQASELFSDRAPPGGYNDCNGDMSPTGLNWNPFQRSTGFNCGTTTVNKYRAPFTADFVLLNGAGGTDRGRDTPDASNDTWGRYGRFRCDNKPNVGYGRGICKFAGHPNYGGAN